MYYNPELVSDLFDVSSVWDNIARPTPVPQNVMLPVQGSSTASRQKEANLFAGNCLGAVGWAERPSATDRSCESSG